MIVLEFGLDKRCCLQCKDIPTCFRRMSRFVTRLSKFVIRWLSVFNF